MQLRTWAPLSLPMTTQHTLHRNLLTLWELFWALAKANLARNQVLVVDKKDV